MPSLGNCVYECGGFVGLAKEGRSQGKAFKAPMRDPELKKQCWSAGAGTGEKVVKNIESA